MRRRVRTAQMGLTVIEALVAIALVAVALVPLLELQGQMARSALAIERAERRLIARENAAAYLRLINPMRAISGEERLGDVTLRWRADALTDERPIFDSVGQPGRFSAQLFRIDATLVFSDGRRESLELTQMGWKANGPGQPF